MLYISSSEKQANSALTVLNAASFAAWSKFDSNGGRLRKGRTMSSSKLLLLSIMAVHCIAAGAQSAGPSSPLPVSASTTAQATPETPPAQAKWKIVLLEPAIRYSYSAFVGVPRAGRVRPLSDSDLPDSEQYERVLLDAARTEIGPRAALVDRDKQAPSVVEVLKGLDLLASRLSRGNVNEDASKMLACLANIDQQYLVLAQSISVQAGVRGTWNPNKGLITSTLLQTALISVKTNQVIWKSEQLIRYKALKPGDAAMTKALAALYKDFKTN